MSTQFVTSMVEEQDSFEAGKRVVKEAMAKLPGEKRVDLALLFCADRYDYSQVLKGMQSVLNRQTLIVGCSSAGQFTQEGVIKEGICCALIQSDTHQFFAGLGTSVNRDPLKAVIAATKNFPEESADRPYQSAMLFVDGLVGKGEEVVLASASALGFKVKVAGAAAADNLSFQKTVVFGEGQALADAVSICLIASRCPIIISVKHGHKPITGPLKVTKAKGNVLYEIEGKPALEVWKDHLREKVKAEKIDIDRLTLDDFSKVLLKYEAGLMTGEGYKIRFPASANADGSLNFTTPIVEGSVIKIMDSRPEDQIASARLAAQAALKAAGQIKLAGAVIFDCACRAMILQDKFSRSIEANKEILKDLPFIGCETYGEIAMEVGQLSGFHNTTTVIMLIPE